MTTTDLKISPEPPTPEALAEEMARLKAENQWLKEPLGLAKHRLFAPSSEKSPVGQEAMLFNEAEACAHPEVPEPVCQTITYTRRKYQGQRKLNLSGLPVEEIVDDLPADQQVCPQCAGALHKLDADVRTEIKIIPATVVVVRHVRTKYTCRHCQNHEIKTPVVTAPMPTPAFPTAWPRRRRWLTSWSRSLWRAYPCIARKRRFRGWGSPYRVRRWLIGCSPEPSGSSPSLPG